MHLTVNLTSLAVILWSGMLIIAGSIWVLSSQVRRLSDLIEQQGKARDVESRPTFRVVDAPSAPAPRGLTLRMVDRPASRAQ